MPAGGGGGPGGGPFADTVISSFRPLGCPDLPRCNLLICSRKLGFLLLMLLPIAVVVVVSTVAGRWLCHPLLGIAVCLRSRSLGVLILIRLIDFLLLSPVRGVGRLVPLLLVSLLLRLYLSVQKCCSFLRVRRSWRHRFHHRIQLVLTLLRHPWLRLLWDPWTVVVGVRCWMMLLGTREL